MADNAGPLTLLNCDNVRHNGERFHDGMVEFLQLTGKQAVIDWMAANTTCPEHHGGPHHPASGGRSAGPHQSANRN